MAISKLYLKKVYEEGWGSVNVVRSEQILASCVGHGVNTMDGGNNEQHEHFF